MYGFGVAVLRVLYEEDHQEGDDGRARVDDELPSVAELEERAGDAPDDDDARGEREGGGASRGARRPLGEAREPRVRFGRSHKGLSEGGGSLGARAEGLAAKFSMRRRGGGRVYSK